MQITRTIGREGVFPLLVSSSRVRHDDRVKQKDLGRLRVLARRHGILPHYVDMAGARRSAKPKVLRAILGALGFPAANAAQVSDKLRDTQLRQTRRCVEPVIVAWDSRRAKVSLRVPEEQRLFNLRLQFEHGGEKKFSIKANDLVTTATVRADDGNYLVKEFKLPSLPFGYHDFHIETDAGVSLSLVISAPSRTYAEPRPQKQWGIFAPMYAVHSQQSWGAGNFSDWARLSQWAGSLGASVAATLPLLAQLLDHPMCEPSPYSPASRLFWNEFYIDITASSEFSECPTAQRLVASSAFQNRLNAFRKNRMIDYAAEWAARREVLQLLAEDFFRRRSPRYDEFAKFLRAHPQFEDYARFRAICDLRKVSWRNWPERLREGHLRRGDWRESDLRFHLYAQWLAQEQIKRLVEHSRRAGVKLYLDLPLGVNSDGYDLWRHRDNFVLQAAAGAPPDVFFTKGQNWGFAPLHPERIRENGYRYVRDFLQFQMRQTGLLRIDHVMGLHRLYWIPNGFPAAEGAYVSYHPEEWYAILSLESHRHKTMLVGENLGTVPPEVNKSMRRHRLRETYVLQYEQRPNPRRVLRAPPSLSLASVNTHDMPTFAAHLAGDDITDRRRLGLMPNGKVAKERQLRKKLNALLAKFLSKRGFLKSRKPGAQEIFRAAQNWLGASRAEIVLVNLEDLWLEPSPQNMPGTSVERPNWRRKARLSLEQMQADPLVDEALREIQAQR